MSEQAILCDDSLQLVRHLPGPIERVWAFITEPAQLATWFSDGVVAHAVGGEISFEMGATGRVTVYEPTRVFEYTWNELELSRGQLENSLVRWELAEEANGVRLTLTHSHLPQREVLNHGAGWHTFLDRLAARADGREPEPIYELFDRIKAEYLQRAVSV